MQYALREIDAPSIVVLRFVLALGFLLAWSPKDAALLTPRAIRLAAPAGGFFAAGLLFALFGLASLPSGEVAFLLSASVLFTPLLQALFTKLLPTIGTLAGIVVTFTGLAILHPPQGGSADLGLILSLVSALCFSVWILALGKLSKQMKAKEGGIVQIAAALLIAIIYAAVANGGITLPSTGATWAALLFVGICSTGIRFLIQTHIMQFTTPTLAELVYCIEPVGAVVIGIVLGGEHMTHTQLFGCVLILCGVFVGEMKGRTSAPTILPG